MKKVALEVKNINKSFRLPTEQASGIKQAFINYVRGIKGYTEQKVLKNISFTVEEGDFFGIVGRNGSGKSTLLKLISQIYTPDSGKIKVNGKLVPFIELGVGFNPELTGRENVYLNGALLGFAHDEISAMYKDIVEFAELEKFMDQKLKNYSSGMQVRLAFSIAIKAQADILVLDEVLAVGDESFQRKCFQYFAQLKKEKKTVILVTHSMDQVQQFCNKAALIDKGHRLEVGSPREIASLYRQLNNEDTSTVVSGGGKQPENSFFRIDSSYDIDRDKKRIKFHIDVTPLGEFDDPDAVFTFVISKDNGEIVYRYVTDEKLDYSLDFRSPARITLELDNIFPNGLFFVEVGIKKRNRTKDYIVVERAAEFIILNEGAYPNDKHWKPNEEFACR